MWLYYDFALHAQNSRSLYNGLVKTWDLSPKTFLGGDSMPNKLPTQTSWLTLESLYRCGDLCAKTLQLYLDGCKVGNTLNRCLLNLLYSFRDHGVGTAPLYLLLHPFHLYELTFNCCYNDEGLFNPRMNACLQNFFSMLCCIYFLFKCFGLLHSSEPLSEHHHLHGPFDVIILLLDLMFLYL